MDARRVGFSKTPPYILYFEKTELTYQACVLPLSHFRYIKLPMVCDGPVRLIFQGNIQFVRPGQFLPIYTTDEAYIDKYHLCNTLPEIAQREGFVLFHGAFNECFLLNLNRVTDMLKSEDEHPGIYISFQDGAAEWFNESRKPTPYGCYDLLRDFKAGKIKAGKEAKCYLRQ